ncbi:hypothetical protein PAXRUDRAFT_378507 [Paxillus rubicundulus Ve08.2h10]|uniref:Uncharacterized protein n=1 Tax=Paxillus rubicundulus Ve08.2h10 TaxID=930991 RepID=A0A0D0DYW6_9AGAM|nr:hypothetical protein PAXRUDRAFT_378507 [Paxillus rubicundulus Ve08.2h10]
MFRGIISYIHELAPREATNRLRYLPRTRTLEWKGAINLRKAAEALRNRFELTLLVVDTFFMALALSNDAPPYTAGFTYSVPFSGRLLCIGSRNLMIHADTGDGRWHVAVNCADGVWTGPRHDIRCWQLALSPRDRHLTT